MIIEKYSTRNEHTTNNNNNNKKQKSKAYINYI